jgi:hypothetical protein
MSVTDALFYLVNGATPGLVPGHVGAAIWADYVTPALDNGKLQAKPEAHIIKRGLEKIQDALDLHKKGVSAQKIVVEL